MKITNNMGVSNYDDNDDDIITTTANNGNDDTAMWTELIPQETSTVTEYCNMIPFDDSSLSLNPMKSVANLGPTPAVTLSYEVPSMPNPIDDISEDELCVDVDDDVPLSLVDSSSIPFLCNDDDDEIVNGDDDDALLLAGFVHDHEHDDDDDLDGASIVAVDELLSLDRILGFDTNDFNVDHEWL